MLDLNAFLKALLRNWWLILLAVVTTTASTAYFVSQQPPNYRAESTIELVPSPALSENQAISILSVLNNKRTTINTYARKATSSTMAEQVAQILNVPLAVVTGANITSVVPPDTLLIEIRAEATDPKLAADISNTVSKQLISQALHKVMKINIIDVATPPLTPFEPQPARIITLSALFGVVLGIAFAVLEYLFQG
ncbi:MAG: lipopolysaccharide biosynthesis protein [Roseiflexaceae bacterium]|nr:lipopolysaccharide biosynthesis protein [Roseiflexaceae bacterium]